MVEVIAKLPLIMVETADETQNPQIRWWPQTVSISKTTIISAWIHDNNEFPMYYYIIFH